MNIEIKQIEKKQEKSTSVILSKSIEKLQSTIIQKQEIEYIKREIDRDKTRSIFDFNKLTFNNYVCLFLQINDIEPYIKKEKIRILGSNTASLLINQRVEEITISTLDFSANEANLFIEGLLLAMYSFDKYKKPNKNKIKLKTIYLDGIKFNKKGKDELINLCSAVYTTRDLVNEPGSVLTPEVFTEYIKKLFSKRENVKLNVFSIAKIKALKMSGLEAVSRGTKQKPSFIVIEYLPKKFAKQKPFVLIGKGVFFDTGGINLKPSADLHEMKVDMSGAATVASVINLISKLELEIPIIGLIPVTENRPGYDAYLPGDVLTMMNGTTVEIKNTDAEGRLILADALCYASKYDPLLTITIATLTGSAHSTFGIHAIAGMQNKAKNYFDVLLKSGYDTYERIVELPLWDEYDEMIKSTIADIQNSGGKYAGAITAGKFLQKFADFPFIHLDIAGPALADKTTGYMLTGGTGIGVRLFYDFFKAIANNNNNILN